MNQYGSADNGGSGWEQSIGNGQTLRDLVAQHAGADGFGLVLWKDAGFGRPDVGIISLRTAPTPTVCGWTIRPATLDGALRSISEGGKISLISYERHATLKAARAAAQQAVDSISWIWRQSAQPTQCAAAL